MTKNKLSWSKDPVYEARMEAAPVWELIENAAPDKKMYLGGIPNLNHSPVTKYLKDKNKTIISAETQRSINKLRTGLNNSRVNRTVLLIFASLLCLFFLQDLHLKSAFVKMSVNH